MTAVVAAYLVVCGGRAARGVVADMGFEAAGRGDAGESLPTVLLRLGQVLGRTLVDEHSVFLRVVILSCSPDRRLGF